MESISIFLDSFLPSLVHSFAQLHLSDLFPSRDVTDFEQKKKRKKTFDRSNNRSVHGKLAAVAPSVDLSGQTRLAQGFTCACR